MRLTCIPLFLVVAALPVLSIADDLTIPNSFQAGTPARAAEVNDNFTAVEASVDDNAADIAVNTADVTANAANVAANTSSIAALSTGSGVMVYSQGTVIGRFLTTAATSDRILVISQEGFVFETPTSANVNPYLNETTIYFTSLNCVGDTYVTSVMQTMQWVTPVGAVFRSPSG